MALPRYTITAGDFQFSAEPQPDGTYNWSRKLLNTVGAMAEPLNLDELPVEVADAFATHRIQQQAHAA